jgi:uncharacterized protein (DUF433 family)
MATIQGVIHGNRIDLERAPGLPDGQAVTVEIRPMIRATPPTDAECPPPTWLNRFDLDPSVKVGKYVVKGTRLLVDDLVELVEQGRSDAELRALHPELIAEDVDAVRHYAKLPLPHRRSFGAWAEDGEELDTFLEWNRQQRKINRRAIPE